MTLDTNQTLHAAFSPKLKTYYFWSGALTLAVTIIGIVVLPLWVVVGSWWARRYYESLKMEVTDRAVIIGKGVFFKQELTIPLDKIQDISVREGPLLNALGLLGLRLETAGQRNMTTGKSEGDLIGLLEARKVRDVIIERRDRLASSERPVAQASDATSLLIEIRDSLHRIEAKLGQ